MSGSLETEQSHKSRARHLRRLGTVRATFIDTFGAAPTVPNYAAECHVHAQISAKLHAINMLFCSRRRKVAGAPRHRSFLREGVGGISFGGQKKRQTGIAWLRLSAQRAGSKLA
jgi:hypothetical protein